MLIKKTPFFVKSIFRQLHGFNRFPNKLINLLQANDEKIITFSTRLLVLDSKFIRIAFLSLALCSTLQISHTFGLKSHELYSI